MIPVSLVATFLAEGSNSIRRELKRLAAMRSNGPFFLSLSHSMASASRKVMRSETSWRSAFLIA